MYVCVRHPRRHQPGGVLRLMTLGCVLGGPLVLFGCRSWAAQLYLESCLGSFLEAAGPHNCESGPVWGAFGLPSRNFGVPNLVKKMRTRLGSNFLGAFGCPLARFGAFGVAWTTLCDAMGTLRVPLAPVWVGGRTVGPSTNS